MILETRIIDPRLQDATTAPGYATAEAAAIDLRACNFHKGVTIDRPFIIRPGERMKIGAGLAIDLGSHQLGEHYAALILPRSGFGSRGLTIGNAPGLSDADYQGEIIMAMWNSGEEEFRINPLERIAQLVVVPVVRVGFRHVSEFSRSTKRGDGGFGHTGTC